MTDRLSISLGQYSCAGAKPANQDFHGTIQPEPPLLATKGIAIAIADGISTSAQGAVAAETAVKSFLSDYYATSEGWSVRTSAERVIAATNGWMHARNVRDLGRTPDDAERERGLITTFSAMVLKSRLAHLFHIGDARIARISDGRLAPLTSAHRVNLGGGESYLARAMGMNRHVEIDYARVPVEPGDLFVLTTDGVHEHLSDAALTALALGGETLGDAARAIADAALAGGSTDNLTVQLVRIDTLPPGEIGDVLGDDLTLALPEPLRAGQSFEGYSVIRLLHSGSRSHVWLARDPETGLRVTIKLPSTEHAADLHQMRALLLEEWVARRLDNPHVVAAAPRRAPRRHACSILCFAEGQTLNEWIADGSDRDVATMRVIVQQIATAIQAFHRREMLHRDLRPHNIVIDGDGTVRLIDFGSVQVAGLDEMARHAADDSAFAGTQQYSAPELRQGSPASRGTDLWSLGVIAYQLLTGALPYGPRAAAADDRAALRRLQYVPAQTFNPDIPTWVDAAIARAVAIDPAARYDELSEFLYDLSHPNPALVAPDAPPWLHRRPERVWQVATALSLAALIASLIL